MRASYTGLIGGLGFAVVLVYLLIVVNFQSWLDPLIIITALPGALAGIVLFLFFTHTTLSVPALMGSIMCMGVATANSILVVAFAKERLEHHGDPRQAAVEAGYYRTEADEERVTRDVVAELRDQVARRDAEEDRRHRQQ